MIRWYLEIRKKSYLLFCTFLSNTEVTSKERGKCICIFFVSVYFMYFTSMRARSKIYIISYITGILRYFRHGQIILKITLWRMMMRARKENSSTHSKKTTRNAFRDSREKNKNECVSTDESQKLTPLLLYLNAHMRSDEKYVLATRQEVKSTEN